MSQKQALSRYLRVFFPATALYVFGILAISWASNTLSLPNWSLYLMTLVPILAVFAWIWSQVRFVMELDEYQRQIQIKAILFGMTIVMAISAGWGLLEFFTEIPKLPVFFVLPGFYLFYGIGTGVVGKKEGLVK